MANFIETGHHGHSRIVAIACSGQVSTLRGQIRIPVTLGETLSGTLPPALQAHQALPGRKQGLARGRSGPRRTEHPGMRSFDVVVIGAGPGGEVVAGRVGAPPIWPRRLLSELFERCSNRGRWGADDELGTLNYITEDKRWAAAALVRIGRAVSIGRDMSTVADRVNTDPVRHRMLYDQDSPVSALDSIELSTHVYTLGLSVPEDISVIAIHDMPLAGHLVPALTTVRMPLSELGRRAIELLAATSPDDDITETVTEPVEVIVRQSTAPRMIR